jgi:peptide/nickel transport system permease protein
MTARAKGLPERTVILKHVFRNAMLPIITIIMFDLSGIVFGGAYLTEIIFGIPGLGRVSFNAIFADDYAVVVAVTLIGAMVTLVFNLLTDIAYTFLFFQIQKQAFFLQPRSGSNCPSGRFICP